MTKLKRILSCLIVLIMCFQSLSLAVDYSPNYSDKVNLPGLEIPSKAGAVIEHGTVILEAEDYCDTRGGAYTAGDTKASGGMAVRLPNIQWYLDNRPHDDIYTKITLPQTEAEGTYKVWIRLRVTNGETASIFWDLNKGTYAQFFYSTSQDGNYRWSSSSIDLKHGADNYIAIKRRGSGYIDKIIITNDASFKPTGTDSIDDAPVYMTEEERNNYYLSLYPSPEIKPINGHPRLYVTPETIPELKKRLNDPANVNTYADYKKYAYDEINCRLDTTKANNHNATLLSKIMARALVWVVGDETDINHAKQTISHTIDYLSTVRTPDDTGDITRSRGNYLMTGAIVYDWLYDVMTQEEKATLQKLIMDAVKSKEIGWPPTIQSSVTSHAGETEIFRDMLAAGVAIYDEYPTLYEVAAGRMFSEMVPARNWLRPSGRFETGNNYGEARFYSEVWADMIMQSMGYDSIYKADSQTIRWSIRSRLASGGIMPNGDMYSTGTVTNYDTYYTNYPLGLCIAGNLYNDPQVKAEFERRKFISGGLGLYDGFFAMLFTDPSVASEPWDEWEYSKYTTYPNTGILARTSWQEGKNADTAIGFMNMHQLYFGDHQFCYTGDFQMYYRGLLAMNTGTYNASNDHNIGYSHRAISGNVMLCYDPNEDFAPYWSTTDVQNDGGQRTPYLNENGVSKGAYVIKMDEYDLDENGIAQNRDLVVSEDVRHFVGPNEHTPAFSYISGDLTNAYTDKVTDYRRSMVFLDLFNDDYPAALVVFDKMSSADKAFKKTWLLHSQEKPEIKGNTTVIKRTQDGFDGKLVNQTMIPERSDATFNVVGGDANQMFEINGKMFNPKDNAIEAGKYRIELSPKQERKDDIFLNSMYVTSASKDLPELKMHKENGAGYVGVTIRDRFVTFSKEAKLLDDTISINVRDNGFNEVSVLLTDMSEGMWEISGNGKTIYAKSQAEKNCLNFKVAPGRYTVKKVSSNAEETEITEAQAAKKPIGDFFIWMANENTTANGRGEFIYQEKPTILRNSRSYIAAETLKEFGADISINGDTVSLLASDISASFTVGSDTAYVGNESKALICTPFTENGTVYLGLADVCSILGYSVEFNVYAKTIYTKKIAVQD
ncbi:MAG: hypothetical protein IKJ68_04905 [Clostridia bacterium]|nr:hypothetical protein [Clostridia bacterium]